MTSLEICWYSWCMHTPGVPHLRASLRSWMSALVGHATSAVCSDVLKREATLEAVLAVLLST